VRYAQKHIRPSRPNKKIINTVKGKRITNVLTNIITTSVKRYIHKLVNKSFIAQNKRKCNSTTNTGINAQKLHKLKKTMVNKKNTNT